MVHPAKILIYVVSYNAVEHIQSTLSRIPIEWLKQYAFEIMIGDDHSTDQTVQKCLAYQKQNQDINITVHSNEENLGYGGNQKVGYHYALKNNFDLVVLLHGDGQYAPEYLDKMILPILNEDCDVVLGSRMKKKLDAIKGGMPIYKWIGNQLLTFVQNKMLNTHLYEFHTGYRAFSVNALSQIPFEINSNYFDFDTEIIIQLTDRKMRFEEIEIPTFYGNEISYVNGFKYAWLIIKATFISRLCAKGWHVDPRFPKLEPKV